MKLLSFGEIIWDVYSDKATLGGAPLNFAAHAALQGNDVYLASAVGEDELGNRALIESADLSVNTKYVLTDGNRATGQCIVSLGDRGVPTYNILENTAYDRISLTPKLSESFDVIAFGTLALRGEYNREVLCNILDNNGFSEIYSDLNIRPPFYSAESIGLCLSRATIVKVSDEELPLITRTMWDKECSVDDSVGLIFSAYPQIKLLVVTCGERGAVCYDLKSKKTYSAPAKKTEVVSTVGAGDSFGATFLSEYVKHGDISRSMELAAAVSAFVVSRKGAIPHDTAIFLDTIMEDRSI